MAGDVIVLERDLLNSGAYRPLSGTAKTVYMDFRMKCQVKGQTMKKGRSKERVILNNGQIEYTYSEAAKKKPPISRSSFMRALDDLVACGLIDVTHSGSGGVKGDKSTYAISERWRHWGTPRFEGQTRPKDKRGGRGFQSGEKHWTKKIGIKTDNPSVTKTDNP